MHTTITFKSDVLLNPVIYQDDRNLKQNLVPIQKTINFLLGRPIDFHNISRRL